MSDLIDRMTHRFLAWKLPDDFDPDAGISFEPEFNEHTDHPMRHEPSGTNLFSYTQAREMVRAMLGDDMPAPDDNKAGGLWYRRWHTQAAEIERLKLINFDHELNFEAAEEEIARLREALGNIKEEVSRPTGRYPHLKRVVALNCKVLEKNND